MSFLTNFQFWDQENVYWREIRAVGWLRKHWSFVSHEKRLDGGGYVCRSVVVEKKQAVFLPQFQLFLSHCF
jgi:hypothetical protein